MNNFQERTYIWSRFLCEWIPVWPTVLAVVTDVSRWQDIFTREIFYTYTQIRHCSDMMVFSEVFGSIFKSKNWMWSQPEWIYLVFSHKVNSLVILCIDKAFLTSWRFYICFYFYFYFETKKKVWLYSPCWPGIRDNRFEDYFQIPPEEVRLSDTACRCVWKQMVFNSNHTQLPPSSGRSESPVLIRLPHKWDPDTSAPPFSPAFTVCLLYPPPREGESLW